MLRRTLLTELNYPLLPWLLLCNILEVGDVKSPNHCDTSAKDISNSFINHSAISEEVGGFEQSS